MSKVSCKECVSCILSDFNSNNTIACKYLSLNRLHIRSARALILIGFFLNFLSWIIIIILNLIVLFIKCLSRIFAKTSKTVLRGKGWNILKILSNCQIINSYLDTYLMMWSQLIDLAPNVWLHSSVGRVSHRYRGGHRFESCWSPNFSGFFFPIA